MALDETWFSEACEECGTAFSLKIKEKLHEQQTEFQKLEIYDTTAFGKLMVLDGFIMLTTRDNFLYHEMMSHPALFTAPHPRRVLIIGGGDCGTLREVLKHDSVELAQQIDIDEAVTRASEKYFPELCESNNDPRAELKFIDGIKWVAEAEAESYDVIIIDSTDPVGPAKGLFTEAFYRNCYRALSEGGVLVQQSESPLVHHRLLREIHEAMNGAGYSDVKTLPFPQPVYPSGWWSCTLAVKNDRATNFRERDSANKSFATRYYNIDIHRGALATPPMFIDEIGIR
ncbi:MAG: polyamine aminopropyltransferase [Gammaproteobacteria bacterium]|nr:polyamine aminopropyltransferase [Gammaproteobacteria bacterium]